LKPGEILRAEREKQGLSLPEVEAATKIRVKYLEALENDDYQEIPGEIYRVGFLRNYARYLGLDSDALVESYKSLSGDQVASAAPQLQTEQVKEQKREAVEKQPFGARRWGKRLGIAAVIAVFALIVLAFAHSVLREKEEPAPPPPVTEEEEKEEPADEIQEEEVVLDLVCREVCWVRVVADGEESFSGNLQPGDKKTFRAKESIKIRLGNAGGVDVIYNGEKQPPVGGRGEVVDKEFTPPSRKELR
jgi:transcriptional regulator with XRE-family HTH domain